MCECVRRKRVCVCVTSVCKRRRECVCECVCESQCMHTSVCRVCVCV